MFFVMKNLVTSLPFQTLGKYFWDDSSNLQGEDIQYSDMCLVENRSSKLLSNGVYHTHQ